MFTFIADGFVFFRQKGQTAASKGQQSMASTIMSPSYQQQAALYKGAIPARPDVPMSSFDDCAKKSATDMQAAIKSNTLVPSMNQGIDEAKLGAVRDVVTKFMNSNQTKSTLALPHSRVMSCSFSFRARKQYWIVPKWATLCTLWRPRSGNRSAN